MLDSAVPVYEDFLESQLLRHACNLSVPAAAGGMASTLPFNGIVVDRSDHTN